MERLLPHRRSLAIALRVIVVLGIAGCSSQQMSASNPFMAPDRVPPPATRTIAPGTAAPYYPGDPMPAAQIAIPNPTATAQAQVPSATVATSPAATPLTPAVSNSQPLVFGSEQAVSIPGDNENLRFSVPPPMVAEQPQAAEFAPQFAATPAPQSVIPASFNQPIASQLVPAAMEIPSASADDSSGPWRSPQISGSASPVVQAQHLQPQAASPTTLVAQAANPWESAAPQMPVELRPVASPADVSTMSSSQIAAAPQVTTPPPRMRFPSLTSPSTWFTPQAAPTANQQLIGYMVPGPNGMQQMVSVEQYHAMVGGVVVQPAPSVANADGFRARGTATK